MINSITNAVITNMLETNTLTGNTFSWLIPTAANGNTVKANVIITDSATTQVTTNSVYSGVITITSITTPTLTLSNTLIDQGQSILFTATSSGGLCTSIPTTTR